MNILPLSLRYLTDYRKTLRLFYGVRVNGVRIYGARVNGARFYGARSSQSEQQNQTRRQQPEWNIILICLVIFFTSNCS